MRRAVSQQLILGKVWLMAQNAMRHEILGFRWSGVKDAADTPSCL
jgi:hypothetical protein